MNECFSVRMNSMRLLHALFRVEIFASSSFYYHSVFCLFFFFFCIYDYFPQMAFNKANLQGILDIILY